MAAVVTSSAVPRALSWGPSTARIQEDVLKNLVAKHLKDSYITQFESSGDFSRTSFERGFDRHEHSHLAAAIDIINSYQRDRKARSKCHIPFLDWRMNMRKQFKDDPRTRFLEMIKRWLRSNVNATAIEEDEVRRFCSLCRDVLNHRDTFPSRNVRSFVHTVSEVYTWLQKQLQQVLERDQSCADLANRALSLGRNLLSDAICYLLLAPTHLRQTDSLPSVEAVALLQSLPTGTSYVLPAGGDVKSQKVMKDAWKSSCGSLIASVLSTPWAVRLFDGEGAAQAPSAAIAIPDGDVPAGECAAVALLPDFQSVLSAAKAEFDKKNFKTSGFAGPFRQQSRETARSHYIAAVELIFDLSFMLGEVLVQFHHISTGLGDYGMIRAAPWLHPFLEVLSEKTLHLKSHLEQLSKEVDDILILGPARGITAEKPVPSDRMSSRANEALQRAVTGRGGSEPHTLALLHVLGDLRAKSAPERMPVVIDRVCDACSQLQTLFGSSMFRSRIRSENFPPLPTARQSTPPLRALQAPPQSSPPLLVLDREALENPCSEVVPWFFQNDAGIWEPLTGEDSSSLEVGAVKAETTGARRQELRLGPGKWKYEVDFQTLEQRNPQTGKVRALRRGTASPPASNLCLEDDKRLSEVSQGTPSTADTETSHELNAMVWRLTSDSRGFNRHDRRKLQIRDGRVQVYEPGSSAVVKTQADIAREVEEFSLHQGGKVLSLFIWRRPKRGKAGSDATEKKIYFFEFASADEATGFHSEILRFKASSR